MYEFYREHDKLWIRRFIDMTNFRDIEFWKDVVRQIPPLVRKLAEYYHIPPSKYPIVNIDFSDDKWEEWQLVFGRKNSLDRFTGGTYAFQTNRIELNPYIYLFEGGEAFLGVIYHELAHWIIQYVDYLNETETDGAGNSIYHRADFWMVMNDIFDTSLLSKDKWAKYRWHQENKAREDRNSDIITRDKQVLESISIFSNHDEIYDGSYFPVGGNFSTGFGVDW